MKYRVWCKNKREYEKDQCFLTPDGRLFQQGAYGNMQPLSLENHKIEKCTGLKDKNGKLIFEGDKLTCTDNRDGTNDIYKDENNQYSGFVVYRGAMFGLMLSCGNSPLLQGCKENVDKLYEVTGNVHD